METHNSYISLRTAKILKRLGFHWECHACYQNNELREFTISHDSHQTLVMDYNKVVDYMDLLSAPTLAVAQRWFREEKNIAIDIKSNKQGNYDFMVHRINMVDYTLPSVLCVSACKFNTYEEALENGIQNALVPLLNDEKEEA